HVKASRLSPPPARVIPRDYHDIRVDDPHRNRERNRPPAAGVPCMAASFQAQQHFGTPSQDVVTARVLAPAGIVGERKQPELRKRRSAKRTPTTLARRSRSPPAAARDCCSGRLF